MSTFIPQHYPLWAIREIDAAMVRLNDTPDDFRQAITNPVNCQLPEPVIGWNLDGNGDPSVVLAESGTCSPDIYAPTPQEAIDAAVNYFTSVKEHTVDG